MKMRRRCLPMFGKKTQNHYVNHGYRGQMMYGVSAYPGEQFRQPNPYQPNLSNYYPFQQQNPYHPQQPYQTFAPNYQQGPSQQSYQYNVQQYPHKDAQFLFQNPLQPTEEKMTNPFYSANPYPYMNPYPKQNWAVKQPGGIQSFMNSFKSQDGTVDLNKMVNTAGQMMNAVSQVTSLVKGFGGIFKT